ncbi:translocation/assembly module TamB [Ciceribacter sp. L1K23]|uniref:translocation/assembly module TamB domain-containing protein n=1 Tax=Ciceribacter sp. L1K23 TaxID=2820276 RepID=UPI001B80F7EA|nr:translocation/assembly module TamB domain-containing protein [Ciceribacter sp. L1K23]MBR0554206.1 translocation/assembly module TamB [Ciceribacter sp. L1K23]
MAFLKRLALWSIRLLGLTAGIAILLGLILIVAVGFTSSGSQFIASFVSGLISSPGQNITISNLGSILTGKLRIESVTLADRRGTYGSISGIEIDWTPSALLGATFRAETVSASSMTIERLPETGEQEATTSGSGFQLPVKLDIDTISLPSVRFGEEVAGLPLSFSASGSLTADGNSIAASLDAQRLDTPETSLEARLVYAPADNTLILDGKYTEPREGLFGTLLRIPGEPALTVRVDGQGPLSDWVAELSADLNGETVLAVEAGHRLQQDGDRQIRVTGGGEFASLMPPLLRETFSGETSVDLFASLNGTDRLSIETARLSTGNLLLTASGTLDRSGENNLQANLVSVGGPMDIRWPLQNGDVVAAIERIDLTAVGPAQSATISAGASLARLEVPTAELDKVRFDARSSNFNLAALSGDVDVNLAVGGGDFQNANLDRAIRTPLTIKAPVTVTDESVASDNISIESPAVNGTIAARYVLADGSAAGAVNVRISPTALPETVAERFDGDLTISGDVAYGTDGTLDIDQLAVDSSLGTIEGNVTVGQGDLASEISGTITNLGNLLANVEGQASFTANLSGSVATPNASVTMSIADAIFAGRELSDFTLSAEGLVDPQAPAGTVQAQGSIDGQQISMRSSVETSDGLIRVPTVTVNVGSNELRGSLAFDRERVPSGELTFDFPQIDLIAAFVGQQLSGDLAGNVRLSADATDVSVNIEATGSSLARDGTTVVEPRFDVTIDDVADLQMNGSISAQSVGIGANSLMSPTVTFTGNSDQTVVEITAGYDNAPARATATLSRSSQGIDIAMRELAAAPRGIDIRLADTATINIANGTVRTDDLTLGVGTGTVAVQGSIGTMLNANATISGMPASLVNSVAPSLSASGTVAGTVEARGSLSEPMVTYRLNWSEAAVAQTRSAGVPPLNVDANGNIAGKNLSIETSITGGAGVSINASGTVTIEGNMPLSLRLSGNIPLGLFAAQLSAQGLVAEGTATVNATISGPASTPSITGSASLNGGTLVDVRRNLTIEALSANVALNGNQAQISALSGRLSGGGSISGNGTVGLSGSLPADITLNLSEAAYVDGTLVSTSASGDLTLRGPLLAGPTLSGNLALGETAITIPERLPATLSELDITHRNAPADVQRQVAALSRQGGNGTSSGINLDLGITTPGKIFVRGRGIDAELGGSLTVRGTSTTPAVSGAFTLTRGRLSILTRRLTFTSGTITFGGNLIPLLNLEASSTAGSTTITVRISGLANDPAVSFSSSPALPEDEILAQLIFGQSLSRLSAVQIAQLADAASQLAGGRSSSLFETLRAGLGVDNLDITTDSEGNAAISAGRYLNDRTYLELQQSGNGGGKAVINLDIGRGVKLRGEAGGDGSSGAGIFYEREY